MTPDLLNGSYSDSAGWGSDPFVASAELDAAVDAVRRSRQREALSFAALRPVIGRAALAGLSRDANSVKDLAVERVLDYNFAVFGRGELADILGVPPSRISRGLRELKDKGIIKPNSDTQHIYFLVDDDRDD